MTTLRAMQPSILSVGLCVAWVTWASVAHAWPAAILIPPVFAPDAIAGEASLPELFPAPPEMEAGIRFWTDVFDRYDSDKVLLHDRDDLSLVWEVVSLPVEEDGTSDEQKSREALDEAREALRERLARLERTLVATDHRDQMILLLAAAGKDPSRFEGAHKRVRAQRGIAGNFRLGLERAEKWLPEVTRILEEAGVPRELRVLPFIESTFNPLARSSAGAAGLWQLMPATARQLGLTVNRRTDQRLDVILASRAAAKMLRQNYDMLGTWPLAITGYNHGPYGMKRAVKAVGSRDLIEVIKKYRKRTFGFASKNFYVEFLAALRLVEEAEREAERLKSDSSLPNPPLVD